MATTLQRKSRQCALYPTPHQGQKSPTGHQAIFYSRSHQGLLITPNKLRCTKKSFVINHCSNGRVPLRRHFNASRDYARFTPRHISVKGRSGLHQPIFYPRSYQEPLIAVNKFHCTKKSLAINHCSNGRVLLRSHFNASRDYAQFTPHHIKAKSRLLAISPYLPTFPKRAPHDSQQV